MRANLRSSRLRAKDNRLVASETQIDVGWDVRGQQPKLARQDHRDGARDEMRFFEIQRNLSSAIRFAALCLLPGRKRHSHQRRIPRATLDEPERRLQVIAAGFQGVDDFDALYGVIGKSIDPIQGIGELTVYDVAQRIGAFLGKAPALVYLHAGTAEGAAVLGFRRKTVNPAALPAAFARLTPAEIEDCLCIYKEELRGATPRGGGRRHTPGSRGARSSCARG